MTKATRLAGLAAALVFGFAGTARAQTTWDGSGDVFWNNAANWSAGVPAAGTAITFDNTSIANLATNNDIAGLTGLSLTVVNPTGAVSIAGNAFGLGAGGINMSAATQNLTISTGVTVGAGQSWNVGNAAARTLAVSGVVAGAGALAKDGIGTVVLSGNNTYTGTITVNAGTLRATTSANALGTGAAALSLTAGATSPTLELLNDANLTFGRNATVTGAAGNTFTIVANRATSAQTSNNHTLGTLTLGGQTLVVNRGGNITGTATGQITFGNTTLNAAGTTFNTGGNALLQLGAVSGAGFTFTKTGTGVLILNNTSTFGGAGSNINVNAGLVRVAANDRLGNAANTVTLAGGGLEVSTGFATTRTFLLGTGGGIFDVNGGQTFTLNSVLTGDANLTKQDTGVLVLGAVNTFGGTARVITALGGLISITADNNLGNATNTVTLNGGGMQLGNALTYTRATTLGANGGTFNVAGANVATLGVTTAGAGSFTKTGTGTLLYDANSRVGGTTTTIAAGDGLLDLNGFNQTIANLSLTAGNTAGTLSTGAGTLTLTSALNYITNNVGSSQGVGTINGNLNLGGGVRNFNVTNSTNAVTNVHEVLINAAISNGGILKDGDGVVTLAGANTYAGTTEVRMGGLRVTTNGTGLGSGAVTLRSTTRLTFDPGAGNTTSSSATTVTAEMGTTIRAQSGTTDLSTATINLEAAGSKSGLREGRIMSGGAIDTATANDGGYGVRTGARLGLTASVTQNPLTGWGDNQTWVYTGQIFDSDGIFSIGENIDDRVRVRIGALDVLSNDTFNISTTTGSADGLTGGGAPALAANSAAGASTTNFGAGVDGGWYDIEIRMHNGTGGAGGVNGNGWTTTFGIGYSPTGSTSANATTGGYLALLHNGTTVQLRSLFNAATIEVDSSAEMRAGAVTGGGALLLNGGSTLPAAAILELVNNAGASTAQSLTLAGATTPQGVLQLAPGHVLTVQNVAVQNAGLLTVEGAGTLLANGAGAGTGGVLVQTGATLGGVGSIAGSVTIADGILAPGSGGVGTFTVGGLVINSNGTLSWELDTPNIVGGGVNDLVTVNGNLTLDGTLNVTGLGGFGAGTYRLFDYTGSLTDNGLAFGTMPGLFNYAVDTGTAGQVNLIVTPIPEPATMALMGLGLVGAGIWVRRRRA